MKNFKRVISAVIALALSASTLVAVSASKFADVDGTSYAEAIEVLTALDIAHGYEEEGGLVFKPEGEITRAEAATLIVGALNMTDDAKAAAGSSKFADVNEKASWATGYVNVGVAQGFINGMGDGTFAPQENVTYAQMCVMLTKITGYGDYAENYGGYPTGYTTMAASTGINKGVSVSAETPLKRGQVAQMLYNAMITPMLGVKSYSLQGNEYEPQDGSKGDFKTLLADKFEGYAVNIKITATPNSANLDKGKVTFRLTKDAFTDETKIKTVATTVFANAFADIDVEPYFLAEGSAIIKQDDDDKWHLVYFKAGDIDSKEYASADFNTVTVAAAPGNTVFNFGSSKEVKIPTADLASAATTLYVNNNAVAAPTTAAQWTALLEATQGDVKFTKDTNGKYDGVFVDYYVIGEVSSARYDSNKGETSISFTAINNGGFLGATTSKIIISDEEVADGNVEVIVKKNGEDAKLSDIAEDDIIAVYTKDYQTATITNPTTITILATDATDTGDLTAASDDKYTFNGTEYSLTNGNTAITAAAVGSSFTAVLDPFGDIYGKRDEVSATNYALVLDYYDGDAKLLSKDGTIKTYEVESGDQAVLATAVASGNVENRVITYKIKKGTTIHTVAAVAATQVSLLATDEYKEVAKKVGSILLSDDSYIVDATDPDLIKTISAGRKRVETDKLSTFASLTDKVKYEAYGWDRANNANAFVIVKTAGSTIGSDSRFAVGKSTTGTATVDSETAYTVTALYDGAETVLTIADGAKVYNYLAATPTVASVSAATNLQGKAFYFTKDSDGLLNNIYIVFDGDAPAATTGTVTRLGTNYPVAPATTPTISALIDGNNWTSTLAAATEDVRLVYGLVSDINSSNVTFVNDASVDPASLGVNCIDMSDIYRFALASDCAKYSYNPNSSASKKADKIYEEGLAKSNFRLFEYVNDTSIVWKKLGTDAANTAIAKAQASDAWTDNANYAFAMIVNEQVVAIYEIVK